MENKKEAMIKEEIYHKIVLKNGNVLYLPTSLPAKLQKFVNTDNLIKDKELDLFKQKVAR